MSKFLRGCLLKLPLFLCFSMLCWLLIGERVAAADEVPSGTFEYNGQEIVYYYTDSFSYSYNGGYNKIVPSLPLYVCLLSTGTNDFWAVMLSVDDFSYVKNYSYGSTSKSSTYYANNCGDYYRATFSTSASSASLVVNSISDYTSFVDAFSSYFVSEDFDDLNKFIPPWVLAQSKPEIVLQSFTGEIVESSVGANWNGVSGSFEAPIISSYENSYVKFMFELIPDGSVAGLSNQSIVWDDWPPISSNSFSLALSQLEIPEGYYLGTVYATPYWYANDNIEGILYRGNMSVVEFTADMMPSSAVVRDPDAVYDAADADKSIWDSLAGFFGGFWNKFNDFDSTEMNEGADAVGDSLDSLDAAEGTINEDTGTALKDFNFSTNLEFTTNIVLALNFCKGFLDNFFLVSGDLSVIVTVGFTMIFLSIILGIARFAKG